jgi:cysteinyl-tRNA synthetase
MIEGQKMAKSSGNLVFVHDLLERFGPAPLRLLLLDRRWRDPWEFDEASLDRASDELEHLFSLSAAPSHSPNAGTAVVAALADDLDVPRAFAIAKEAGGEPLRNLMGFLGLI